jgi:hypothetical protein
VWVARKKRDRLEARIGAQGTRIVEISIWVPNKDRNGMDRPDQAEWKEKALRMFSELFGKGATAMPPADGAWLNPETKILVREEPIMVFCYVTEDQVADAAAMRKVGVFCREMGEAMFQGEVALRVGDRFFLINTF